MRRSRLGCGAWPHATMSPGARCRRSCSACRSARIATLRHWTTVAILLLRPRWLRLRRLTGPASATCVSSLRTAARHAGTDRQQPGARTVFVQMSIDAVRCMSAPPGVLDAASSALCTSASLSMYVHGARGTPPCQYQPLSGLLRLVCGSCDRPVDSWSPSRPWLDASIGGFGILQTPALTQMIMALQAVLLAALGGAAIPTGQWGCKRSGRQLLAIAMDLTVATVLSAELSIERHWSPSSSHEQITLAALPPYTASGLMALIAALLQDLGGRLLRSINGDRRMSQCPWMRHRFWAG